MSNLLDELAALAEEAKKVSEAEEGVAWDLERVGGYHSAYADSFSDTILALTLWQVPVASLVAVYSSPENESKIDQFLDESEDYTISYTDGYKAGIQAVLKVLKEKA
ncbi:hypothetical protein PBI_PEREGRIN_149 [Rhodococcus phage Peregrin]|nr:hypothetical protein PBI_PEREGRIN_149 [Rhodococcus phage Peregrin]